MARLSTLFGIIRIQEQTATVVAPTRDLPQRAGLQPAISLAVAAAVFAFVTTYLREFLLLRTPLGLWGDQVGFFNDGSRIVAGQLPYRDYFTFLPPASDLLYAALIRVFGLRIWIPNLLMAFTAALVALLMTLIAQRLLRGRAALLPALLLAGFVLLFSNDPTHHWFSTIAALAAVLCVINGSLARNVALAGIGCGVAMCFTQTKGLLVVVAFAVFLLSEHSESSAASRSLRLRNCALFVIIALAIFATVNAPFIYAAGWKRWFYCLLEFPLRYYPAPKVNNWRVLTFDFREHAGPLRWIVFPFLFVAIPGAYAAGITALRNSSIPRDDRRRLLLLTFVGIAMIGSVIAAPSIKRLATVSPPAMLLLAWLLNQTGAMRRAGKYSLTIAAVALAIAVPLHVQLQPHSVIGVPAGRVALIDPGLYAEYAWLRDHTHPGEYCFGLAPFYYTFHLRNPAPIEGYDATDYTRPEQVSALVESLEAHQTPLIVLRWSQQFLTPTGLTSDHLGPFRAYLLANYKVTQRFATGDDLWQRNVWQRNAWQRNSTASPETRSAAAWSPAILPR